MNNEMLYAMFANTLSKMSDQELEISLEKAKGLMSAKDYESLMEYVQKEREKNMHS